MCRWLLRMRDLAESDDLILTQEFLAQMLGVRRPGVTVAIGILERAGLIAHGRGRIKVTNRKGLEAASCECYAAINLHFNKLIGWSPTDLRTQQVGH